MFTNLILHICQSGICVEANCTCFTNCMLHLAVITSDIAVFDLRAFSTGGSLTIPIYQTTDTSMWIRNVKIVYT